MIEGKLGRKLSKAEFGPFQFIRWNRPGQHRTPNFHHKKRCHRVMRQATITEDDIIACQEMNDSDFQLAKTTRIRNGQAHSASSFSPSLSLSLSLCL
jgi:sarcosine oxidase delta subunit